MSFVFELILINIPFDTKIIKNWAFISLILNFIGTYGTDNESNGTRIFSIGTKNDNNINNS